MYDFQKALARLKSGKIDPVYLFFGEERYLQEELLDLLVSAFLDTEKEYGLEKIDGSSVEMEELIEKSEEGGLFSGRRIILVDNPHFLIPPRKKEDPEQEEEVRDKKSHADTKASTILEDYLNHLNLRAAKTPDIIYIFTLERVDRRRKLYKLIDKNGVAVECQALKGEALVAWVRQKTESLGKKIDRTAIERLLLSSNHNLHYLSNEILKYATYLREKENVISSQIVDLLFSGDIQSDVFKMADALATKNLVRADNLLQLLLGRREKPLLIFHMIVRHYRLLLQTRCLLDEGLPASQFSAALEVKQFVVSKLRGQASLYSRHTLEEILVTLQETDQRIKTGVYEPTQALSLIISRIDYLQCNHSA